MREVEAQPIGRDQRAFLRDMAAEHALERGMQQMCRRMIGARGAAAFADDAQFDRFAQPEFATGLAHDVHMQAVLLFRVGDGTLRALGREHRALIADLTAGFAIERCLVGEDESRPRRLSRTASRATVFQNGADDIAFGVCCFGVVAERYSVAPNSSPAMAKPDQIVRPGFARCRPRPCCASAFCLCTIAGRP